MLKAVDIVVLSWSPLQCLVEVGDSICGLADWGGGSHLKKREDRRVSINYQGITLLSLPGEGLSRS